VRRLFHRLAAIDDNSRKAMVIDICVLVLGLVVTVVMVLSAPIRSVDHLVWYTGPFSSPFEVLFLWLMIPLLGVVFSGWLRLISIWRALRCNVLEPLEAQPIRDAFSRLDKVSLMTMFRQGGVEEHRQELARSKEAIRQMLVVTAEPSPTFSEQDRADLQRVGSRILREPSLLSLGQRRGSGSTIAAIEKSFAEFAGLLLKLFLVPYWTNKRKGCVQSDKSRPTVSNAEVGRDVTGPSRAVPEHILVAEEFIVLRYVSFIRAVLTNVRYIMMFVSAVFILAITAWNSYPFQPTQYGDWVFTGLLLLLGAGMTWVFAQICRNPILSRLTDTVPNELGWEFYLRIAIVGALPVITWFAYQFPEIGGSLLRFVRPGLDVLK
jgi:hypothetical protein